MMSVSRVRYCLSILLFPLTFTMAGTQMESRTIVDEIGKMECFSASFIGAMRRLLKSDKTVIATVGKRGTGFITEIKQRSDCLLWEITYENCDKMPERVLDWLKHEKKVR